MKFLEESYEIVEHSEMGLFQILTHVSNRTHFELVDPVNITIFSLLREPTEDEDAFEVIKTKPAFADMRLFLPQKDGENYFSTERGNIGKMPYAIFLQNGASEEMLEEVKRVGYFMQVTTEENSIVTLIPSKGFLATLCRCCGVGKLEEGVDPMRDIYLASRLVYADPFTLVYRTDGRLGKAFGCFSPKFGTTPQLIVWDFKEELLRKYKNTTVRRWEYNHFITSVDFTLNDRVFRLGKMRITPGIRFTLSDVGDASYTFRLALYCNGGYILLPEFVSRKRSGTLNISEMIEEFYEKCIPELYNIQCLLEKADTIPVENIGENICSILSSYGFISAIGKTKAVEYYQKFRENTEDGTMVDVLQAILKISGIAKKQECNSCLKKTSECIGSIFTRTALQKILKD